MEDMDKDQRLDRLKTIKKASSDDEDFRNSKDKPKENDSTNDDGNQVNFQSKQRNILKYTLNSNKATHYKLSLALY